MDKKRNLDRKIFSKVLTIEVEIYKICRLLEHYQMQCLKERPNCLFSDVTPNYKLTNDALVGHVTIGTFNSSNKTNGKHNLKDMNYLHST